MLVVENDHPMQDAVGQRSVSKLRINEADGKRGTPYNRAKRWTSRWQFIGNPHVGATCKGTMNRLWFMARECLPVSVYIALFGLCPKPDA